MNGMQRMTVEGPERGELIDDAMNSNGLLSDFINRAVAELAGRLDTRLTDELLQLPPGTLLCAHGAVTWMPQDLRGGRLSVARDTHVIASGETCTASSREILVAPWLCRGCGQRRTIVEGQACEVCLNRFRRETLTIPAQPEGDRS